MKIEIDLEDIKAFGNTLSSYEDEWYGPINHMTVSCIKEFFEFLGNTEASNKLNEYLENLE